MTKKKTTPKSTKDQIPIKWNIPDTVITRFATNMVVQQTEDYVKLTFFEVKPEINLTSLETPTKEVNADCVASIIVTPAKLFAIVNVLQRQVDTLKAKIIAMSDAPTEPEQHS